MANLITGDAVSLDLRIAGLPSRTLALAVDLVVQVSLLMIGTVLVGWVFSGGGSPGAAAALTLAVVVLALVVWPTVLETVTRGRSLGKLMMGLRVVRDDGGPIRMRHSLVRALAMVFLDLWVTSGVVGGLSALISARAKRMGDHLAGTIVVGERMPRSTRVAQEIALPAPLAGWAVGLDLVGLPDGLALNVRTFLHRTAAMDPAVRHRTAEQLATEVAGYVRTPAPMGTPAEAYLAAVLAERTRRASMAPGTSGWNSGAPRPVGPSDHRTADRPSGYPGAPPSPPTLANAAAPAPAGTPGEASDETPSNSRPTGPPPGFTLPR